MEWPFSWCLLWWHDSNHHLSLRRKIQNFQGQLSKTFSFQHWNSTWSCVCLLSKCWSLNASNLNIQNSYLCLQWQLEEVINEERKEEDLWHWRILIRVQRDKEDMWVFFHWELIFFQLFRSYWLRIRTIKVRSFQSKCQSCKENIDLKHHRMCLRTSLL